MSAIANPATSVEQYRMFIDGEFVSSRNMILVLNPATEEAISEFPAGTPEQVDAAVLAAERAQPDWARLPAIRRAKHLREIAEAIRRNKPFLARTISREQGKILPLAETEVDFSADYVDYMAEFARRYQGEIIQSDRPGENILLYKFPIGVVAGILPWNFPFLLIVRKVAPALVTGNTIVIKPSEETPTTPANLQNWLRSPRSPRAFLTCARPTSSSSARPMSTASTSKPCRASTPDGGNPGSAEQTAPTGSKSSCKPAWSTWITTQRRSEGGST